MWEEKRDRERQKYLKNWVRGEEKKTQQKRYTMVNGKRGSGWRKTSGTNTWQRRKPK